MPRIPRSPLKLLRAPILLSIFILAISLLPSVRQRLSLLARHLSATPRSSISTMSTSYSHELQIALLAVQRASILTKAVYNTTAKGTLSKSDHSPVTIGDFGAQALIISALRHNFPSDEIVAEEEASDLRENEGLREQVWSYVQSTKLDDAEGEKALGGPLKSVGQMIDIVDQGKSSGGNKGRIWAIDPIDGTKGFLRGGQYAVCLALMVDGQVKVGVLGCPNLPVDDNARIDASIGHDQKGGEGKGVLISAVEGEGTTSRPLSTSKLEVEHSIQMRPIEDISKASFCESVEAAHSNQSEQGEIARRLGIVSESVRMDSQAKYASIARGAGDVYLRLPTSKTYQEKIWDHAAGDLIVREAGGQVTDSVGNRLDFSQGRTLAANKGVVAAPKVVHDRVLEVVKQVLAEK
jgi:3'(2'), 5'-bisphosphate nucleotidase